MTTVLRIYVTMRLTKVPRYHVKQMLKKRGKTTVDTVKNIHKEGDFTGISKN